MLFENDEHQVLAQNEVLGDVLVSVTGNLSQSAFANVCKTRSSRLNCALQDDEAVYWVSN